MTRKPLVVLEVFKACDIRIGPAKYPCTVEETFKLADTRIGPAKYACNDEDTWTVLSPVYVAIFYYCPFPVKGLGWPD